MRSAREMHLDVIRGHLAWLRRSSIDMADYIEGYLSYGFQTEAEWNHALVKPSELMAMLRYFEREAEWNHAPVKSSELMAMLRYFERSGA